MSDIELKVKITKLYNDWMSEAAALKSNEKFMIGNELKISNHVVGALFQCAEELQELINEVIE